MDKYLVGCLIVLLLNVAGLGGATALAGDDENDKVRLSDHEPNLVGYTYDGDDKEPYLDFKVSLQYPIAKEYLRNLVRKDWWAPLEPLKKICKNSLIDSCQPSFAFTGRFGQYIEVRDSSPVIGKRFNPKVFLRLKKGKNTYLDLEYGHESNGQSVSSLESYNSLADDLENKKNGERYHANDYISRGWDYVGLTYKYQSARVKNLSLYLSYADYIGGILQGDIEEYFSWESPREITARDQVCGWRLLVKWEDRKYQINEIIEGYKLAIIYDTGTDSPFHYSTFKVEVKTKLFDMPIMVWAQQGYNSDLAQYYKDVDSYGLAFELETF